MNILKPFSLLCRSFSLDSEIAVDMRSYHISVISSDPDPYSLRNNSSIRSSVVVALTATPRRARPFVRTCDGDSSNIATINWVILWGLSYTMLSPSPSPRTTVLDEFGSRVALTTTTSSVNVGGAIDRSVDDRSINRRWRATLPSGNS